VGDGSVTTNKIPESTNLGIDVTPAAGVNGSILTDQDLWQQVLRRPS
jgi:hypothetical protein